MKIGNPIEKPAVNGGSGAASRPGVGEAGGTAKPAATGGPANESATVQLSSTAASLMSGTPDFDAEKVNQVRQSIADGSFKINAEAIADKLIANARELLDRSNSH
ncbi:flagellar biosynthesis anti-sigma factor FlgM [Schlegelella sp. S2-27]|uniref:Negative regulator of flagellin synthesis n=1 Tax=Caldimonas mangrovi TaxID=2944811 RepID=A0ABT0YNE8_9BURK|nr:flagellar biosynthesis anti-sigma factor FlgM [Caldimonas mangrovi]MCM5679413.1 flagellar biosynthesis anti-sigma factor FlgM [Caldimonas mangrovi]